MRRRPTGIGKGTGIAPRVALSALLIFSLMPAPALAEVHERVAAAAAADEATAPEATPETASPAPAEESPSAPDAAADSRPAPEAASAEALAAAPAPEAPAAPAPAQLTTVYVDGTNGDDAHDGASFDGHALKTLEKALELRKADPAIDTICVRGAVALAAPATIPSGVTLSIDAEGAAITGQGNSYNGIVLASGSVLKGAGTLTMTGFKTALVASSGSLISDGHYVFSNNASNDNSTTGISLYGLVRGSSGRDKLTIVANDGSETNFYGPGAVFENCTVNVTSQSTDRVSWTLSGSWIDTKKLVLKNADMTVAGINAGWYVIPDIHDSVLTIAPGPNGGPRTSMAIQGSGTIENSTVVDNGGWEAGISVGGASTVLEVVGSTLSFNNGGTAGLNVNSGTVKLTGSTIKGNGQNNALLFGAQPGAKVALGADCVVDTPAKSNADNGGAPKGGFVVTGGAYQIKYAPSYNSSLGSTVPTNGEANGNESLSLFTLADTAVASLSPLNKDGQAYEYGVARATADGQKRVWVPAAAVTFELQQPGAAGPQTAAFADGSAAAKTASAIRGYALSEASAVAGGTTAMPADPVAPGYKFVGWRVAGTDEPFTADTLVKQDTTVYAKWEADAASYAVKYHNGAADDVTYLALGSDPARTAAILSIEAIEKAEADFVPFGKTFAGWNTKPDGTGETIAAGSTVTLPEGVDVYDLYAQWQDQMATVKFSANGGVFSDTSVFKTHPQVFEIQTDANGGEVAVVKAEAKVSDKMTLGQLFASLDNGSVTVSNDDGLASPVSTNTNAAYTGIATYPFHTLAPAQAGFWLWTNYFYWFNDPAGTSNANIAATNVLTQDVTYYLNWQLDPNIQTVELQNIDLPSDMWSGSEATTSQPVFVETGHPFSITGAIDAQSVVERMDALQATMGADTTPDQIELSDTASVFTATVTLPDGVVVPADPKVTATGLGDCFVVSDTKVDGQNVTVTFSLNPATPMHTFADLYKAVASTGNGPATTLRLAAMPQPKALQKPITVTIDGLALDPDKVTNGQELTATGKVDGTFSSIAQDKKSGAVRRFQFGWVGKQIPDNVYPQGAGIQQILVVVAPYEMSIPADLLVGGNTENREEGVYPVLPGQKIAFTGEIGASAVKDQMRGIEAAFPGTIEADYAHIALTGVESSFTATLALPDTMKAPEGLKPSDIVLDGFSDTFSVTGVQVEDGKIVVTMKLKDGIDTYAKLREAVIDNLGDTMKMTVPGITISDALEPGATATVAGTVEGTFQAHATNTDTGTTKIFSFAWHGRQTPDGMDATAASVDQGILFTVQAVSPVTNKIPGDMLVAGDTEHTAPLVETAGKPFPLTGAIYVRQVQDQMAAIEASYPDVNHDQIALSDVSFAFKATFTVPEGMSVPAHIDPSEVQADEFGPGFKVSQVEVDGRTVTVTFALTAPDGIATYSDLEEVVDSAGADDGWMKLTVPGLVVDPSVAPGTDLTIVGTVGGTFGAVATKGETRRVFSFAWNGAQWPDGRDAIAPEGDETIQLTVKVAKGEEPVTPEEPANPETPTADKPGTPDATPPQSETPAEELPAAPDMGDHGIRPEVLIAIAAAGLAAMALGSWLRRRSAQKRKDGDK